MTDAGWRRTQRLIIAALLLVIAALAWKFIVAGSTLAGADGRTTVVLAPGERALMLREMRGFVAGLQRLADALARDDVQGVAAAARAMGTGGAHDLPVAMLGKLPLPFKQLAFATHQGYDAIARDADAARPPEQAAVVAEASRAEQAPGAAGAARPSRQTLRQLATVLQNCVACHDRYRLSDETPH